jgi:hypothetical protein
MVVNNADHSLAMLLRNPAYNFKEHLQDKPKVAQQPNEDGLGTGWG